MDTTLSSVMEVFGRAEVSALDAARFVRNILDAKPSDSKLTDAQFVLKVIEVGLRHIRTNEMSFANGFDLYYETKKDILRPDSLRDIRYLANRLMRSNPQLANRNFSEISRSNCEEWLNDTFSTPSQFKRSANEILPQAKNPKGETVCACKRESKLHKVIQHQSYNVEPIRHYFCFRKTTPYYASVAAA